MTVRSARCIGVGILALVLCACDDGGSTIEIRARSSLLDDSGLAGLHVSLDGVAYDATDFHPDPDGVLEVFATVPDDGVLELAVRLERGGASLARGSVFLEMAPRHEWGVDLFRADRDPAETCFGCRGSVGLEIAGSDGESLWIVWGGQPRGSDIVH